MAQKDFEEGKKVSEYELRHIKDKIRKRIEYYKRMTLDAKRRTKMASTVMNANMSR